jgi:hypothetical protein
MRDGHAVVAAYRVWINFHPFPDGSRKLASTLP